MVTLEVNGQARQIDADPGTPLLYCAGAIICNSMAPSSAAVLGQCGACTVTVDGQAVFSLRHADIGAAGPTDHDSRGSGDAGEPWADAASIHRGAGCAMRLLHCRHDDASAGAAGTQPVAVRSRDPRSHECESLPVRHAHANSCARSIALRDSCRQQTAQSGAKGSGG